MPEPFPPPQPMPQGLETTHRGLHAQAEGLGSGRRGELPDAWELSVQCLVFCNNLAQVLLPGERAIGQGPLRSEVTAIAFQRAEVRSYGARVTHEDLVDLPRLQACVSSGVLRSIWRAPRDIELNVSCPEHSSHIILLKWASPSAVHATPRIDLVPVIKLLSLSSKFHPSTPGSVIPGGGLYQPHFCSETPTRFLLGSA